MSRALFVSDLHLDPEHPEGIALLRRFGRELAAGADDLYLLGDLFEMWIGDDADDEAARAMVEVLGHLSTAGTRCHLMHGNRDFLMGERLARACGARLLPDPVSISLDGRRCVLSHGDALCTDDTEYMALRAVLRSPAFAEEMLARSLAERAALGADARRRSREDNAQKPEQIMDVAQHAVDELLDAHDADLLIHGHTHRPAVHRWQHGDAERTRIVLGDWGRDPAGTMRYAEARGADVRLHAWP